MAACGSSLQWWPWEKDAMAGRAVDCMGWAGDHPWANLHALFLIIHDRLHDRLHDRVHDRLHDRLHERLHDRLQYLR